jgi:protein phosphatase
VKWEDKIHFAGRSDVGLRRGNNQDYHVTQPATTVEHWQQRGHLFLVADGMGAHAVGELASKLAGTTIAHTYQKLPHLQPGEAIRKAFEETNSSIHNRGKANKDFQGMGTTTTALLLLPDGAVVAHVGDSRAYRVRNGRIDQLSFDHSLAWELVRKRHITLEQARGYVPTNVITRSLGPEPDVEVDVEGPHQVEPGDTFILCSDGLSGPVSDVEIGLIARHLPPEEACERLVDLANLRGGPDNITVIVVRVTDEKGEVPAAEAARRWTLDDVLRAALLGGGALCGLGLAASITLWKTLGWSPWLGIGISVLVGVVAALAGWYRARRRAPPELDSTPTTVGYQHADCALDDATLTRFADRIGQFRTTAIEQAWNVDWTQFFNHRQAAEQLQSAGDRSGAMRELCRAIALLGSAQRRWYDQTSDLLR